ncbi:alkane 1-monooxygenase [Roseovarius aestuariivivens]|uniref:alkane 1-monooxygenase n=1 Tax=Roseovarius aestuariivivens TaxID=1888910 RepID=UPI001081DAD0|nr:alkane 1-monooxygenase [Roseovarius aestuariivivens]
MRLFTLATLMPAALIALGVWLGGVWPWLAVGYLTVLVFALDRLIAVEAVNADPDAEFPAADVLLVALGVTHFAVLALALWAIAGPSGLSAGKTALIAIAASLMFGQVSHPVAHELIHRNHRSKRLLGRLIYTSLMVGHHASAHLRVHHVHVGSDADPNSAPRGEGFYRYALRASVQSFLAGLRAETHLRSGRKRSPLSHPYVLYVAGGLAMPVAVTLWGGGPALAGYLFMALYAQVQILMSDYVQHYGLRRRTTPDGRLEPVGPRHSWNAPHWFSSALMLNAPRHSDHHTSPSRPYPALQLDRGEMPILPYPLPVMAGLALLPPLWRRVLDRRLVRWQSDADAATVPGAIATPGQ